MEIKAEHNENEVNVYISGKLSFKDHPEFNSFIEEIAVSKKNVLFDISDLEQIDSAGIGMMFLSQKVMEEAGASITIRNPRGQVKRVFEITSIEKQIPVINDN